MGQEFMSVSSDWAPLNRDAGTMILLHSHPPKIPFLKMLSTKRRKLGIGRLL